MNGQEQEDEVFEGASSAEYWMYDSRTGRRFENDPVINYSESPYATFANSPISMSDPDGLTPKWVTAIKNFAMKILHPKRRYQRATRAGGGKKTSSASGSGGLRTAFKQFFHRWGNMDFNIGNLRLVSRRYRGLTRFRNPFYHERSGGHNNNFFQHFPMPHFGISIGLL